MEDLLVWWIVSKHKALLITPDMIGFHASSITDYAVAFQDALSLSSDDKVAMRKRARTSAKRFTEEAFANGWTTHLEILVKLCANPPGPSNQWNFDSISMVTGVVLFIVSEIWYLRQ